MIDFAINLYDPDRVMGYKRYIIHYLVTIINGEAVLYQIDPDQSHHNPGCAIYRHVC